MSLVDRVLELQAFGLSSYSVARLLDKSAQTVRLMAHRAGSPFSSMVFSPMPKRPLSHELLEAMKKLPSGCCAYIAAELDDPLARPCGQKCCISSVSNREPRQSAWCLEHHLVVYPPKANADVKRRVWEEG